MNKNKGTGTPGKKIIYEEKAPFGNMMKLLMVLIFSILVVSIFIFFFQDHLDIEKEPLEGQIILISIILILILAVWSFFKMKFRITEESVEAVMPPFSYHVLFSEIKEVSTTDIPWYVGWGLRIWGRRLAFVSMHKKGVKIEKENGFFKALVITAGDPDEFIRMVKQRMNSLEF